LHPTSTAKWRIATFKRLFPCKPVSEKNRFHYVFKCITRNAAGSRRAERSNQQIERKACVYKYVKYKATTFNKKTDEKEYQPR